MSRFWTLPSGFPDASVRIPESAGVGDGDHPGKTRIGAAEALDRRLPWGPACRFTCRFDRWIFSGRFRLHAAVGASTLPATRTSGI